MVHVQQFSIFAENRRVAGAPALSHIPRVVGFATLFRDVGAAHFSQAQYQWTLLLGSEFSFWISWPRHLGFYALI